MLLLVSCQIDVQVDLDVQSDGSGTVTMTTVLDEAAAAHVAPIGEQLQVGDLERAGWTVSLNEAESGPTTVTLSKPVADSSGWQSTLDELAGPGVFRDVEVVAEDGTQELQFTLDLGDGWDLFVDDDLLSILGDDSAAASFDRLVAGRAIDEVVDVGVNVTVLNREGGIPAVESIAPRFDAEPTAVSVLAAEENSQGVLASWIAMALTALAVLSLVLAVTGVVLQRRADRLRPTPLPESLGSRVPGSLQVSDRVPAASGGPRRTTSSANTVRLVVVEPLAVFYGQARSLDNEVLPFVRGEGSQARGDTIADAHTDLRAGRIDTGEFWELCGVNGSAAMLDAKLVDGRELRSDAAKFLHDMQRRDTAVAAMTSDAAAWSTQMREADRLHAVGPWLVAGEVGTRAVDGAMFEVLRRQSGVAYGHCVYVDADLQTLDVARDLGMRTALFDTGDLELPAVVGHPVITDLADLFGAASAM